MKTNKRPSEIKTKTVGNKGNGKKPFVQYSSYICSQKWQEKQKQFLKETGYRCSFLGSIIGKKFKGKYRGYNLHHMNYKNLGDERLWIDVILVSSWVHTFIIHGVLSGFKRPSQQKSYPNLPQRCFHFWCCQPHLLRVTLMVMIVIRLLLFIFA